ncbi:MAG TPA: hypothetical protein VGM97_15885 [Steroidobacteraceae bacterium]
MSVSANGAFTFSPELASGSAYSVSVSAAPANPTQTCTVSNGTGTLSANVTNIAVQCATRSFHITALVSGLVGSGLVLQDDGADNLTVATIGPFVFATAVASGAQYAVAVATQPTQPSQNCAVSNAAGVVGSGDVTVNVVCTTIVVTNNAASVAQLGNTTGETLMQFASFMGERLQYLSQHLTTQVTENCSDPYHAITAGTATYLFTDNDGSGTLTPGDTVVVNLAGCLSQSLADYVTGAVTLTLITPTNPAAAGVTFAANAAITQFQLTGLALTGSLTAQYGAAETLYTALANVGATPLTFTYANGWVAADTVLVSHAQVSKVIDYTQARYTVQIASTFQSQALGGQFAVSTPTPLSGRVNVYPDTGMEVFTGGSSVLRYAAQNILLNEPVSASLDETGGGQFLAVPGLFWEQGINGFAWWEPRAFSIVQPNSRPSYGTIPLAQWNMQVLFTEPQAADPVNGILSTGLDVATPIKLFFNAPVDPSTDAFVFNTAIYYIPGQVAVPAAVTASGPILSLTAQSQLQHGEVYRLASVNRVATSWPTTGAGAFVNYQLTTLNNLVANAAPSPGVAADNQTVHLASAGSISTNSTIVAYAWAQTSGTTVTLSGASAATASFVVPAAAPTGSSLQFTLTVTDANGETDSIPVTVFVLNNLLQPFVYYHAQQMPGVGQTPENATFESPLNGTVSTEFDNVYNLVKFTFNGASLFDQVQIGPGGVAIVPGNYGSSVGNPNFFDVTNLFCGSTYTWTLAIHEALAASDGTIQTFSADFTYQCGNQPSYSGSVRVGSSWPLP